MSTEDEHYARALMVIGVGKTRIYIDEMGHPATTEIATLSLMSTPDGEVFDIPVESDVAAMVDSVLAGFAQAAYEETPPMSPQAVSEVVGSGHAETPQDGRERVPQATGAQRAPSRGPAKVPQL